MKYGKKVFVDKNNLEIGKYPEQLQNAIENSNAFILILNEDSWRQDTKIDVYYEEIIRIANTKRDILTIEYVSGTLKNIPIILADELARKDCKLSDFEKITVYQNPYYNFEAELCSKIRVAYQAIDPNLPKFTMSKLDSLIDRSKVDALYESICDHRFCNLVGIGGSGKTSLTYLLAKNYDFVFNNIAYVVVNGNIKDDFTESMNKTLNKCENEDNSDVKYNKVFVELKMNYSVGNNLLVLDINEITDKKVINNFVAGLIDYPNNWKFLILSREQIDNCHHENLNDDEDKEFLKKLFVEKAGKRYENFDDFDGLFELIKYSPLLAEQLGIYLKTNPDTETLDSIKKILYSTKFRKRDRKGVTILHRTDKENTIIGFLSNLVRYKKFNKSERFLLRHFVLWKSEYIEYKVIKDLLEGIFDNYYDNFFQKILSDLRIKSYAQPAEEVLKSALDSLERRSILNFDETKSAYKLHGLLADSIREQIDVTKQNYWQYIDNIRRIRTYNFRKFLPFADCIGNSLCEYEITTRVAFLNNTGIKFKNTWKTDYAKRLYEKCIEISETKLKIEPKDVDCLEDLSYAYNNLANLQKNQLNDYKSAEKNYNKAIEIDKKILQISDTLKYQNSLAEHYNNLSNLQQDHLNDIKSAETNYKEAIKIREKITQQSGDPEYLNDLASTYFNLALLQQNSLNDSASAEDNYNKAIEIGKRIRKTDNPKAKYLNQLAKAYGNLAVIQTNRKDYDAAKRNLEEAIKIGDSIKDENIEYLVSWLLSKRNYADILVATGNPDAARVIINEIKPIAEEWVEKIPNYGFLQRVNRLIKDTESKLDQ
ncbi:MAG: tetratricopeptide repeat protein [Bacteroidales bacterium]|nr:tetratricopeptide repeat protein [Bacteroidales bacterium]